MVDPPRQITTRNLPDMSMTTTYTLEEENGGTRFTVTETGFESLSEDVRKERLDQNGKGWEMALENLKAYIDGRSLPRPEGF
ncbi:MAG TPA: SRPBCC domain-containing protein [Patescibacteria group bacterium]